MDNLLNFPVANPYIVLDELAPEPIYLIYRIEENSKWTPIDFAGESELRLVIPLAARDGGIIGIRREEECAPEEVRWLIEQIVASDGLAAEIDSEFPQFIGCECNVCGDERILTAGDVTYDCPECGAN